MWPRMWQLCGKATRPLHVRIFNWKSSVSISLACHCRFRYEGNHLHDMSAEEDNELPPVKTLLQVLNTNTHKHFSMIFKKFTVQDDMSVCFLTFFFVASVLLSRMLGKRWSRVWWNWPRLAPEFSSSKASCRPARRRLSRRCLVLQMNSTMTPCHCKSTHCRVYRSGHEILKDVYSKIW